MYPSSKEKNISSHMTRKNDPNNEKYILTVLFHAEKTDYNELAELPIVKKLKHKKNTSNLLLSAFVLLEEYNQLPRKAYKVFTINKIARVLEDICFGIKIGTLDEQKGENFTFLVKILNQLIPLHNKFAYYSCGKFIEFASKIFSIVIGFCKHLYLDETQEIFRLLSRLKHNEIVLYFDTEGINKLIESSILSLRSYIEKRKSGNISFISNMLFNFSKATFFTKIENKHITDLLTLLDKVIEKKETPTIDAVTKILDALAMLKISKMLKKESLAYLVNSFLENSKCQTVKFSHIAFILHGTSQRIDFCVYYNKKIELLLEHLKTQLNNLENIRRVFLSDLSKILSFFIEISPLYKENLTRDLLDNLFCTVFKMEASENPIYFINALWNFANFKLISTTNEFPIISYNNAIVLLKTKLDKTSLDYRLKDETKYKLFVSLVFFETQGFNFSETISSLDKPAPRPNNNLNDIILGLIKERENYKSNTTFTKAPVLLGFIWVPILVEDKNIKIVIDIDNSGIEQINKAILLKNDYWVINFNQRDYQSTNDMYLHIFVYLEAKISGITSNYSGYPYSLPKHVSDPDKTFDLICLESKDIENCLIGDLVGELKRISTLNELDKLNKQKVSLIVLIAYRKILKNDISRDSKKQATDFLVVLSNLPFEYVKTIDPAHFTKDEKNAVTLSDVVEKLSPLFADKNLEITVLMKVFLFISCFDHYQHANELIGRLINQTNIFQKTNSLSIDIISELLFFFHEKPDYFKVVDDNYFSELFNILIKDNEGSFLAMLNALNSLAYFYNCFSKHNTYAYSDYQIAVYTLVSRLGDSEHKSSNHRRLYVLLTYFRSLGFIFTFPYEETLKIEVSTELNKDSNDPNSLVVDAISKALGINKITHHKYAIVLDCIKVSIFVANSIVINFSGSFEYINKLLLLKHFDLITIDQESNSEISVTVDNAVGVVKNLIQQNPRNSSLWRDNRYTLHKRKPEETIDRSDSSKKRVLENTRFHR